MTEKFFDVKKNVKYLIGKENAESLFEELTDVNVDEMVNKYYKKEEGNNDNKNNINNEKSKELKKYVEEYINIMDKVRLIKNQG